MGHFKQPLWTHWALNSAQQGILPNLKEVPNKVQGGAQ